jgi:hypothetical protein
MEARKISVKLRRDPRETAERHSQANPLTLECTLASGEAVTETMELRAELHAAQTPATTPLAATSIVTMTTGDVGPWELEFSGAQMNQTVLPDSSEDFWLVIYATNGADDLFTLGKIALTLTFDNVSQVTPQPPDPALFLDLGGTQWKVAQNYEVDDIVGLDGSIYICTTDNLSTVDDEPGVGMEWESFWVLFSGGGGGSGDVTGPASSADNAITRFNGTTGKVIQNSAATLDDNGGIAADTLAISTTPTGSGGTGIFRYDTGEKVPEVGIDGITLKMGVQEYVRVYNSTPSTLTKGQIVYINGAQGNRVSVALADATDESTSAGTIGIVAQSITAAGEGFVQTSGPMYNLNTNGLTAGSLLFLSETAGQWTATEPTAPAHGVRIGYVERVSLTVGSVFIKIDNGYELGELHNVSDTASGITAALIKNSATGVWQSRTAAETLSDLGAYPASNPSGYTTNTGTVTSVSVTTANGVSATVTNGTTTPALSFTLGAITPTSVNGVTIANGGSGALTVTGTASVSGTNTGNVSLATSLTDVLALSGQQLQGVTDAGADRILFFDQSATKYTFLTVGTGLSISGTTITATFDPAAPGAIGGTTPSTAVFTQLDVRTELDIQSTSGTAGPILSWNTPTTEATNWERASLAWSSNVFTISTQRNGTGVAREMAIAPGGVTAARFTTDGKAVLGGTAPATNTTVTVGVPVASTASAAAGAAVGLSITNSTSFGILAETTAASSGGGGCFASLYANDGAAMASGDRMGGFLIGGSSSSANLRPSVIAEAYATQAWVDGSAYGSAWNFATTQNGTTTRTGKMWINGDGNVGIGANVFSVSVQPTARLQIRGAGTGTGVALLVENSSGTARFTVRDDGAFSFGAVTPTAVETGWTNFTNLTTDRTCDANATTVEELADILGTLIVALKNKGILAN